MNANALARTAARWNALPGAVRIVLAGSALALLAVAVALVAISRAPRVTLFATPLHGEQLGEVEERLAEWNVPFAPSSDNVIVDAGRRNDLLLRLSLAGVPHDHVESSAEALAGIGVLTPPEVVDERTRAGLAGDIELALRSVDGVDDARVIVVPAAPAEFAGDAGREAGASVRLRLRPGAQLSRGAVSGIRAFVASSVAGLDPARVTILDDRGVALSDRPEPSEGDDSAEMERSLQSALDAAFGAGATIVRVRTELDRRESSEREVVRAPAGTAAIARDSFTESYAGDGKRYEKHGERDDGGSDVREVASSVPPGGIARVSTAVFVDSARSADLFKVRELASAVVGYDPRRGDELTVQAVAFDRGRAVARGGRWWALYGIAVAMLPALIVAIALVAAARYAVRPVARFLHRYAERAALSDRTHAFAGVAPASVHRVLANEPPYAAAAVISALPAATAAAVLEMYPTYEREAIVRRMQRPAGPLIPTAGEVLGKHG